MLICALGGHIKMEPKKWPKQVAFIFFRKRNKTFYKKLTGQRNLGFECFMSEESKQLSLR